MHAFLLLAALCADPDVEAMKRSLEEQISALQRINTPAQKGGDPTESVSPGSGAVPPVPTPPAPELSICPCQGYRGREFCYCLQRGVKCGCNRTKGSEWNMEAGRPVSKTGRYADPRGNSTIARRDAPAGSAPSDESVPTKRADGNYWWKSGGKWYISAVAPTEGREFQANDATFVVTGGRMVPKGSQMAVDIAPKGHFEMRRQCVGGVCRMYRVWVAE